MILQFYRKVYFSDTEACQGLHLFLVCDVMNKVENIDHGQLSLGVVTSQSAPSRGGSGPPPNTGFLGPHKCIPQKAYGFRLSIVPGSLTLSLDLKLTLHPNPKLT